MLVHSISLVCEIHHQHLRRCHPLAGNTTGELALRRDIPKHLATRHTCRRDEGRGPETFPELFSKACWEAELKGGWTDDILGHT
ncbi:MAG: hypothetical protein HON70_38305 [Lentisphaerae bacterium]|nr:hypothetical protein [Lentisphaerota bacterium]